MAAVQNIRIRYVVDRSEIDATNQSLGKLSATEQKLKTDFDAVNNSAKKSFDTIDDGAKKSSNSLNNLNGTLKGIGTAVLAAFALDSVVSFGKKVIELTSQFQKYEAVLTNSLGSQKEAKAQLALLTEEAIRSNFSLSELTSGYIKLVNQGFKPTVQELRQLQDLSNFTGKSFDQLIEAVLDAQQDQFIRLKDFGIKAKKEGEQVTFTFKEQSTVVKNTAADIRAYLVGLGNLQEVQGTTAAISSTLNGRLSNLGDNFDKLFVTLGQGTSGPLNSFIDAVNVAVDAITRLIKGSAQIKEELALAEIGKAAETVEGSVKRAAKSYEDFGTPATEAYNMALSTVKETLNQQIKANETLLASIKQRFKEDVALSENQAEALREEGKAVQNLIDLDLAQLAALEKLATKKDEVSKTSQKDLDKEYSKRLAILQLEEQNALRLEELARKAKAEKAPTKQEAENVGGDITEKLRIEENFNKQRVNLFKQYNQTNIEELKGYNIKYQELNQERLEYLRGQEEAFTKIVRDEDQAKFEIEQEYLDSVERARIAAYEAEQKRILDEVDAILKAEKEKERAEKERIANIKKAGAALYQGLSNLAQEYFRNQQAEAQVQYDKNEQLRSDELKRVGDNKQAQAEINNRFDRLQRKLQREQAQTQKEAAIFQIGIYTAEAVVKSLPNLYLAGVVAALGLAQLALVASRPVPKFAKGVEKLSGEGTETSDSIWARLSVGERVVTAQDNKDYYPALHAIHNHHISPELLNNMVLNYDSILKPSTILVNDNTAVVSEIKTMSKKLDNIKQVNVNIDKNGVHAHLQTQYARTEFVNNYVTK